MVKLDCAQTVNFVLRVAELRPFNLRNNYASSSACSLVTRLFCYVTSLEADSQPQKQRRVNVEKERDAAKLDNSLQQVNYTHCH